jgi:hypothetical protein
VTEYESGLLGRPTLWTISVPTSLGVEEVDDVREEISIILIVGQVQVPLKIVA